MIFGLQSTVRFNSQMYKMFGRKKELTDEEIVLAENLKRDLFRYMPRGMYRDLFQLHAICANPETVAVLPYRFTYNQGEDVVTIKAYKASGSQPRGLFGFAPTEVAESGISQAILTGNLMKYRFLMVYISEKFTGDTTGHAISILVDNATRNIYLIDPMNDGYFDPDKYVLAEAVPKVEETDEKLKAVLKRVFQDKGYFITNEEDAAKDKKPLYKIVSLVHVAYECHAFVEGSRKRVNEITEEKEIDNSGYCVVLAFAIMYAITTYVPILETRKDIGRSLCIQHFIKHFICHPRCDKAAVQDEDYLKFLSGHTEAMDRLDERERKFVTSVLGTAFNQGPTVRRVAQKKLKQFNETTNNEHYCTQEEFFEMIQTDFDKNCVQSPNAFKMLMDFAKAVIVDFAFEHFKGKSPCETYVMQHKENILLPLREEYGFYAYILDIDYCMYKSRIMDEVKVKGILQRLHERYVDKRWIRTMEKALTKTRQVCEAVIEWMDEEEDAVHEALEEAIKTKQMLTDVQRNKLERQWRLWNRPD
jgi:hypothetical protein